MSQAAAGERDCVVALVVEVSPKRPRIREVLTVLKRQPVRDTFADLALVPAEDTPAEFTAFHKAEIEKWVKVEKAAGFAAD